MSRIAYPFIDRTVVASNLREAIKGSDMTFCKVAAEAGVRPSHLSRFLQTGSGISPEKIERIAAVLNTDVRKLYAAGN